MGLFIPVIIIFVILIINIINIFISKKRYINIENENIIEILKQNNYKYLEIKRKRRARGARGYVSPRYHECALEHEFPMPWPIMPPEDIIEIYGVKNKDKKYLIYKIDWSKDNAKKFKKIVEEINKKINILST